MHHKFAYNPLCAGRDLGSIFMKSLPDNVSQGDRFFSWRATNTNHEVKPHAS